MAKLRKDVIAVVHHIRVSTPQEHIAKLFIGDVPADVGEREVAEKLEAAGYRFEEFGVKWASHYFVRLPQADPQVRGAWRSAEGAEERGDEAEVEYVTWSELNEEEDGTEVLFLRVPARLKEALCRRADADQVSLNEYCARALAGAAQAAPVSLQPATE